MLKQTIQSQTNDALKAADKSKLNVLRFVLSLINYAEIDKKTELTDDEIVSLLQKEVKKRLDAIEMFKKGGRIEGIAEEEKQIAVIKTFLPAQISSEELEKIVNETIISAGPNPQIGKVIGAVMAKVKGKADGGMVASLVKQKLIPV